MRRIRREEIKPEPYEIVSDALDNSFHMVHRPQFYSKFRAYLFTNFCSSKYIFYKIGCLQNLNLLEMLK